MAANPLRATAMRITYELAIMVANKKNGIIQGELPVLFDQEEAIITKSLMDEALNKYADGGKVSIESDNETPNICKIKFTINKTHKIPLTLD